MIPGFYDNIPEADYHAARDSLSVSGAKTLLKAPALFKWQQDHPVEKAVFDQGSAVHAAVLGAGIESIYVAPFDDWKTKAAQAERKLAYAERMSPILPHDWEVACDMAEALRGHAVASALLSEGRPEVSAYALDEEIGVLRRGRIDWLHPRIVVDYKTAITSEPEAFARGNVAQYGYHMQAAWYLDLARDLGHPAEGFVFIVQMKEPPYLASVVELTAEAVERGRELNRRALERFRDCTESGVWPGFTPDSEITPIDIPRWAYYDQQESA